MSLRERKAERMLNNEEPNAPDSEIALEERVDQLEKSSLTTPFVSIPWRVRLECSSKTDNARMPPTEASKLRYKRCMHTSDEWKGRCLMCATIIVHYRTE